MRAGVSYVLITMLLVAFVLPLFYVASAGPAIWCRDRGIISQRTLVTAYGLVGWLSDAPWVGRPVTWYCNQWCDQKLREQNAGP